MIALRNIPNAAPTKTLTFEQFSDAFKSENWQSASDVSWLLIPLAILSLAYLIYKHINKKQNTKNLPEIFTSVAQELGIHPKDQKLLSAIAQASNLQSPITLLCSDQTFDHYYKHYLGTLKHLKKAAVKSKALHLRQSIFGTTS